MRFIPTRRKWRPPLFCNGAVTRIVALSVCCTTLELRTERGPPTLAPQPHEVCARVSKRFDLRIFILAPHYSRKCESRIAALARWRLIGIVDSCGELRLPPHVSFAKPVT